MSDDNEDIQPWMQQKGEQNRSFYYFTVYRDRRGGRIIENVIDDVSLFVSKCQEDPEYPLEKIPKIPTMDALVKLSSRWKWVDRCRAWDEHLDKVARTQQELDVKKMVERHAEKSKELQDAVLDVKDDPEFNDLTPTKKAWVLNTTTHSYSKLASLERVSRGEPADMLKDEEENKQDKTAEEIEDLFSYAEGGNEEDDTD